MTRTDSLVVGTLVVLLALIAGLVGVPSLLSTSASTGTPSPPVTMPASRPYREGVLGHPVSVSPLSARTQADRDMVALVYSGLVRNGPKGTIVPDLAERWSVDPTGATWTFQLRDDATWHDGQPVTAEDVAFTIRVLQDPKYSGPGAGSWNEVTVQPVGMRTVVFTLATPLGGFLQAATQPIAPAHVLAEHPGGPAGRRSVGPRADRLGTVRGDRPRQRHGRARPRGHGPPDREPHRRCVARRTRFIGHARQAGPPDPAPAVPGRHRVPLLRRSEVACRCLSCGRGRRRLRPDTGGDPGPRDVGRQPRPRLSGLDIDRRPAQPATGSPRVRRSGRPDGAARGDRPDRHHLEGLRHGGDLGQRPHPAVLVAVRPAGGPAGRLRPGRGDCRAQEGRLDQGRRRLAPAQGQGAR